MRRMYVDVMLLHYFWQFLRHWSHDRTCHPTCHYAPYWNFHCSKKGERWWCCLLLWASEHGAQCLIPITASINSPHNLQSGFRRFDKSHTCCATLACKDVTPPVVIWQTVVIFFTIATSKVLKTSHLQSEFWESCMFTDEAVVGLLLHICAPWEVSLFSTAPAPNTWSRTTQKVHSDRYKLSVETVLIVVLKSWSVQEMRKKTIWWLVLQRMRSAVHGEKKKKLHEIKRKTLFLLNRITLKYQYIHILLEEAFSY